MQFSLFGLFAVTTAVAVVLGVAAAGHHFSRRLSSEVADFDVPRGWFDVKIDVDMTKALAEVRPVLLRFLVDDAIKDDESYAALLERSTEFKEMLCTGSDGERVAAVILLAALAKRGAPTVDGLIFATQDDNKDIRIFALLALAELDDRSSDVFDAVERRLEDDDPEVRRTAQEVLQQIQDLR
jgi:hypothetical protein